MKKLTGKQIGAVILGNLILGIGIAILRISQMGNDPFCAMNMALSESLGIGLGTFQMSVSASLFIIQIIIGRNYIGLGTLINLAGLGYVIEYAGKLLVPVIGTGEAYSFGLQLIVMVIAMLILTFGLAMYQAANAGVAPYDYLALGMTDHFPTPYFLNRVATDGICVLIILGSVAIKLVEWKNCHLGIGTIVAAFCLGPLVDFFTKIHTKWVA